MTWEPYDELPADPEPVYICDECDAGIPEGERYYLIDGMFYCKYCIKAHKEIA